jgi:UDP-N-acetylglucosamine 4,6-dehydratase
MFNGKKILITGGTGSWANELVLQLLSSYSPSEIRIFSRGEQKQVEMKHRYNNNPLQKFFIGDVRDLDRLDLVTRNVDFVFHMAALKHVPVCEDHPWESVLTNIYGTQNVIEASIRNKVKKVVYISSDKAVDPLNIYGVTKQCGEKLIISANNLSDQTKFVCVRGGNVIGSAGSVIPLFREQIRKNNEITLTEETMTRFYITLKQAIQLVFKSIENSHGGEIFVMKMPSAKIKDLADVMVEKLGNEMTSIRKIGIRPGEKIHEVLVSRYEADRTIDAGEYFIILPMININSISQIYQGRKRIDFDEYASNTQELLTNEKLGKILLEDGWLGQAQQEGFLGNFKPESLKLGERKWL